MRTFTFQPRWKEELVCTCSLGSFILELPMGSLSAYLPPEDTWQAKAPLWAQSLWSKLREELQEWCTENHAEFVLYEFADVYFQLPSKTPR
jgi:hypothetical protein